MSPPVGPVVVLVPVRSPGAGKTRLAWRLDPAQRAALSGAMLADVVDAVAAAPVDGIVVAAGGPEAAAAAAALGLEVVLDPPGVPSLDAALAAATGRIGPVGTLAVVTADLPRLSGDDVAAVLDGATPVVVAPTDDGGTGCLVRRPPAVIATAYGPGSAARHVRLANAAGVAAATVSRPGLRHDVDTWDDVAALRPRDVGPATRRFLVAIAPQLAAAN